MQEHRYFSQAILTEFLAMLQNSYETKGFEKEAFPFHYSQVNLFGIVLRYLKTQVYQIL